MRRGRGNGGAGCRSWPAAVVLLFCAAVISACGATSTRPPPPKIAAGSELGGALPARVARIAFTDERGHTVHLSDFRGKTVVIQDMLTLCQEHCPIDTAAFVGAARATAASPRSGNVVFLSITVDPRRDTPAQLAAYRRLYAGPPSSLPHWKLLTGSPRDIALLWKALHVYVQRVPQDGAVRNWRTGRRLTYDVNHGDEVFFLDHRDHERYVLVGQPSTSTRNIPTAMQSFMSRGGRANQTRGDWSTGDALKVLDWLTAS